MEIWRVDATDVYWFPTEKDARTFANEIYENDLNGPIPFIKPICIDTPEQLVSLLEA
jgi:hypothetical protein|tara:strand:+ start:218 stop:388 length:171 start_codon:yes stop_codon:yes gene_type:complete